MRAPSNQELDLTGIPAPDLLGEIERRARTMPAPPSEPPPFPPSGRGWSTAFVVTGAVTLLVVAGILLLRSVGHGNPVISPPPPSPSPSTRSVRAVTPCSEVLPGCTAERLPDLVLRNGQTLGALGPVDGLDLAGILSSDEALRIGGAEGMALGGKVVRVVLGSADADRLHWGHGTNLYYGIDWGGVCQPVFGPPRSTPIPCSPTNWGTVLDAHTGAEIVSGNGPAPQAAPENPWSVLEGDTHTPKAQVVELAEPIHFGVGPAGEDVLFVPADPGEDAVSAQTAVDQAWRHEGDVRPTAVRVEFGLLQGRPEWWVAFDGLCLPGTGPSQPPGTSPRPVPSCIHVLVDRIDGHTGEVVGTFAGSP